MPERIIEEVFVDIYKRRAWGEDCESVSGPGSTVERTSAFRDSLPILFREFQIRTLLDAGCGDFNWMRLLDLNLDSYVGIDVVPALIEENERRFGNATRRFAKLDFVSEQVSRVDLILSRDCLVHLSFDDIFRALRNFKASGSTYLLATTFPTLAENREIGTGEWWPLNFQLPPFNFSAPLTMIDERRRNPDGQSSEKYLGLWELTNLPI